MAGDKFKPQYKRLLFIDKMIRAGKYPSCASLAAEWEVSAKTIQRDIDYLKYEMAAPIEYDKSRHGLYYGDNTWFLPAVLLSEGDILALLVGTHALEMYKGTPVAEELKSIYTRLAQLLPDKISLAPELIFNRFSFHGAPARPINADIWKTLIRGVLTQRVLLIEYASPRSKEPKHHTIHPLHMANIEGDWYVLAFETRWVDIAQFAVSRIIKAELKDEVFTIPKGFNTERLMKDRFGKFVHTAEGKQTTVRLLFKPQIASSIAERPWHPEQKVKWHRDGQLELAFPVRDLRDIMPWLLSHGASVRPLSPEKLRVLVNSELEKMLAER
jgi:predicted DNA-binding transcriptional regulator YafY